MHLILALILASTPAPTFRESYMDCVAQFANTAAYSFDFAHCVNDTARDFYGPRAVVYHFA